jgi:hypothetical protein
MSSTQISHDARSSSIPPGIKLAPHPLYKFKAPYLKRLDHVAKTKNYVTDHIYS